MKYTKEQLEAMSDFEIDTIISKKQGVNFYVDDDGEFLWLKMGGQHGDDIVYSPTSIPNHIMPLVFEENISIQAPILNPVIGGHGIWFACDTEDEFVSKNKNPLRAAAIVYILVKQSD